MEANGETKKEFVIPGDYIGVAEEFLPGNGAYEENGKIYATLVGNLDLDMSRRSASVVSKTNVVPQLKEGDIVYGEVVSVKPQMVYVDLLALEGYADKKLSANTKARIYVSQTDKKYVKTISTEFRNGDIVRARVVDTQGDAVRLSTAEDNLGVIRAVCGVCKKTLQMKDGKLECEYCSSKETRKTASDYLKAKL
ncbi:MAG: Exosome complex component Csl4 [Candidatus Methanofastidiosum methylothiophilum]|uniref:Exosome complex component Csl4 n=1 Tax=Candidatus Methanofastidiosum methylothiophilum TaxID=1705564 RepID=A0A150IRH7_9EURY|nr:MAG: Exosome complex component Csl4 [Candidatus Methanofastidiosum methylthiophilus]KYC47455.1 MAG: Exosome complex component Csl4 [Candidatus Methanofastidiosum methylthiophilus]KYC50014.1 MAG: Exosome complex component Csl4 [Candidatus Methanofastidiosum methylthiophilus]